MAEMDVNSIDLANFLQNAVRNNNDGWGNGNNGLLWVFLMLLFGGYGGGYGGWGNRGFGMGPGSAATMVTNDSAVVGAVDTAIARSRNAELSDALISKAIEGNKDIIQHIANVLEVSTARVQDTLGLIKGGVEKVAGQLGLSTQQVINAIQSGDTTIANQMHNCCCELKQLITNANYENQLQIVNQTNSLGEQLRAQTAILGSKIDVQTQIINEKFNAIELREQARIIDKQQAEITDLKGQLSTKDILNAIAAKA